MTQSNEKTGKDFSLTNTTHTHTILRPHANLPPFLWWVSLYFVGHYKSSKVVDMIRSLLLPRSTNITSVLMTHRVVLAAARKAHPVSHRSVATSSASSSSSSRPLAVLASLTNDGSQNSTATTTAILAGWISSSSRNAHDQAYQRPPWLAWMALGIGGSTLCVAKCEEEEQPQELQNDNDDDDDDDFVEEDPYDNLPPEDEPTHCSICLTYRQGPCRPYWRKVERCTKDHEFKKEEQEVEDAQQGVVTSGNKEDAKGTQDEEEEDQQEPPCLKYMLPWIDCASSYRNLYSLIELDTNYTAGIIDLEKEAAMELCWAPSAEPAIDWTPWQSYVAENPSWKLPKRAVTKKNHGKESTNISLWKTLDVNTDPELVDVLAMVPTKQGEGIIECAYALDQEGNVLGFSYGTKPSEAAKQAEEDASLTRDGQEEPADLIELKIRLLPLRTRHITIAAAYTQPLPKKDSKSTTTTEPESHIFKSRPFSLKKLSKAT